MIPLAVPNDRSQYSVQLVRLVEYERQKMSELHPSLSTPSKCHSLFTQTPPFQAEHDVSRTICSGCETKDPIGDLYDSANRGTVFPHRDGQENGGDDGQNGLNQWFPSEPLSRCPGSFDASDRFDVGGIGQRPKRVAGRAWHAHGHLRC